jgi:hypothetical protein
MIRSIVLFLTFALLASGCGEGSQEGSIRAPRTTTVTEQQAIQFAKDAVRERDGWTDTQNVEAQPTGNGWTVTVYSAGTGEPRLVILDGEGEVIQYQ